LLLWATSSDCRHYVSPCASRPTAAVVRDRLSQWGSPKRRSECYTGRARVRSYGPCGARQRKLFIYPDAGQHRIWMYRTHFPLDLVWLNHRQQIIDIAQGVAPLLSLNTVFLPAVRTSKNSQLCVGTSARFCRTKRSPHRNEAANVRQRPAS
jgi:hypothetical protein